jgi:hypothetical protein
VQRRVGANGRGESEAVSVPGMWTSEDHKIEREHRLRRRARVRGQPSRAAAWEPPGGCRGGRGARLVALSSNTERARWWVSAVAGGRGTWWRPQVAGSQRKRNSGALVGGALET